MRTLLGALLLVVATSAVASQELSVNVNESRSFQMMGASAAWPVDASIVEASANNGTVTIFGRAAGRTKIMVVSITGENALDVVVASPVRKRATEGHSQAPRATAEVRYSSAMRDVQNSVTVRGEKSEAAARVIHHLEQPAGERSQTSVATAYYRLFDRGRELTLLDRDVDHSVLTLSRTPLRGVHYLDEHWRLHAGYTAFATYESLFIPIERQFVAGAGYAFRVGARATLTPSVFNYRGEGTVVSLMHEHRDANRLLLRSEVAWSRGIGAAFEGEFANGRDRARADIHYRGDDFAVASPASPRGLFADASWSRTYGRGSNASAVAAATDVANTRVLAASADVDHRLNEVVSLAGGASWGSFDGRRTFTIPAGVRLDFARGGIGALYRYTNAGHGFRINARASLGRVAMSAFADRQENAPTLDLIFAERPDLAIAMGELGIIATTPADIARALREHAELMELGFIEGVTIDLAPVRTQLGFDLALLGTTASRQQLRARLLHNITESVSSRTATTIASLSWSRRITASTDVFATYSWWRTERRGQHATVQPAVEAGVRQRLDGIGSIGSGTITGVVFADEDLDGRSDGNGIAAVIELDGARSTPTATDGSFAFHGISRGTHRVVARVPDRPHAYFTTPSVVEAQTGETIAFGVATTPARVHGRVVSDAGTPIGNVRLILSRGPQQRTETTGDDGRFAFAAAPGEWQLAVVSESIPTGYSMTDERTVMLNREQPLAVDFALRAHRTISGSGAPPNGELAIQPLGKTIRADAEGRFLLRSLPAGELTIRTRGIEQRIIVPPTPISLAITLESAAPESTPARTAAAPTTSGNWLVLLGAYRVASNAERTLAEVEALGVDAETSRRGTLTIVQAGPFPSRQAAANVAAKLTRAGIEAVVSSRN